MESYSVRLDGDDLVFSAAHFITLAPGQCEGLHGHDMRVGAEVTGPLGAEGYVVDFVALRRALKEILAELDHRVLLPTGHEAIRVQAGEDEVEVVFQRRRWVFPRGDCVLLDLANTTAELLARWLARRLAASVAELTGAPPERIRVELAEGTGQAASCELTGR
ncbi:MAG: 6-pyruvoyl tetrahydropterin synthase family protein [Pirellulales bacterium]|nr:6-pyruvoyl tetrahydropterin synthase family protein [Pirellulales bacterium]